MIRRDNNSEMQATPFSSVHRESHNSITHERQCLSDKTRLWTLSAVPQCLPPVYGTQAASISSVAALSASPSHTKPVSTERKRKSRDHGARRSPKLEFQCGGTGSTSSQPPLLEDMAKEEHEEMDGTGGTEDVARAVADPMYIPPGDWLW
ncbi:hypothetical protein B0H12DRAFT_1103830, partial [Mycena haematopus]